jgi:glycerol kinase
MAYQTRDVVEAMQAAGGHEVVEMRVDGGAAVMDLLLQFQADQIGVTVSRPLITETTALGSAMLAGLAEGVWSSTADIAEMWHLDVSFEPTSDRTTPDELHRQWLRAVERSRGWAQDPAE